MPREIWTVVVPYIVGALERTPGAARRAMGQYAWREGVDVYDPATREYQDPAYPGVVVVGPVRDLFSNEEK